MAPNNAVRLINSQASQPELLVPTKETTATTPTVANTDQEQRAKTDRAKGWYDYKVVFDESYGLTQRLAKFVPEHLEKSVSLPYAGSEFDTWTVVPDPEATLLYPFLANSKHTDCVLNLTGTPPSYSRMPNFAAVNAAYHSADCVVLMATEWYTPQVQVENLVRSLTSSRGWKKLPLSLNSSPSSKPKPVVYLLPSVSCEQFKLQDSVLAEKRVQAQEMLKQYPEVLVLEMDFSDRKSISKGVQQLVQYLKSGKGVNPSNSIKSNPVLDSLDSLDDDLFLSDSAPTSTPVSSLFSWLFPNNNSSTPLPAKSKSLKQASSPPTSSFPFLNNLFNRK